MKSSADEDGAEVEARVIDLTNLSSDDYETADEGSNDDHIRVIDLSNDEDITEDDQNEDPPEKNEEPIMIGYVKTMVTDRDGNTVYDPEEDRKDGKEVIIIGKCPECNKIGPEGNYCTNCEDTGLIYQAFSSSSDE